MNPDNPNFRTPGVQKIIDDLLSENKKLIRKLEYKQSECDTMTSRCADAESFLRRLINIKNEIEMIKLKEELITMYSLQEKEL